MNNSNHLFGSDSDRAIDLTVREMLEEAVLIESVKIALKGRNKNNPCLCGSGKKYKSCCRGEHTKLFNALMKSKEA